MRQNEQRKTQYRAIIMMRTAISAKTIIALPHNLYWPQLSEAALFCLEVAAKQGFRPDEVWVLGEDAPNSAAIERWFPDAKIRNIELGKKRWPLDVGSNQFLQKPLTLYAAMQDNAPAKLITPLHGASAYFALMARAGGLLDQSCEIIQTCYLPTAFESEGSLILPTELSTVLDTELEAWCARHGDALWITHDGLKQSIADKFDMPPSTIRALPLKVAKSAQTPKRHIVFAGVPSPLYGFDAFLDLAESLDDEVEHISVFLKGTDDHKSWQQAGYKRLHALKAKLDWHRDADIYDHKDDLTDAVLVCPMRTPIFPLAARAVHKSGMQVLWGMGFETPRAKTASNVHNVISDVRKLKAKLLELWDIEKPDANLIAPTPLKTVPNKAKPKPRPLPAVKSPSIIVLHHNRTKYLDQALASLAAQTDTDFELVLVDDGSAPEARAELPALIKKHGFKNAQISTIENAYPSVARNHGAAISNGDTVLFMDDDNLLAPETIAAFKSALASQDVVLSFYQTFTGETAPEITKGDGHKPAHTSLAYGFAGLHPGTGLFYNLVGNSCFMIRRTLFEKLGGFSPKYGVGLEDYAFLLKASFKGDLRFTVLPEPYLHFRLHADKIRNTHIDWRSPERLQAGHWRVIDDIASNTGNIPAPALAYARQLHELTQYQYVAKPRPKYFRLKSVMMHQYLRPFLAKRQGLRKLFLKFAGKEGRLFRVLERWFGR
ncbi:MAG: glycosyltransferase family 2 protein [Robiginitomaculum sp.]|nr:glycosyltransferase family 2 protein [Robiginitomaculum sp.]